MKNFKKVLLLSATLLLISANANAQATTQADPARAKDQFMAPRFDPEVKPRVEVKESISAKAPEGADKVKINLSGINFSGMKIYEPREVEYLYKDKVGKTVTLSYIYDVAQKLTRRYRNDGYVLTQVIVPPQTIEKNGVVKLRVVEGFIDKINVEGTQRESAKLLIKSHLDNIDRTKALNVDDLEQALLLVNSIPGISAKSVLNPSDKKVGAADLSVFITRKDYEGELSLNNYGTSYLGEVQASASIAFNSLFDNNEQIGVQFVIAPDDKRMHELFYGSFSYTQPLGSRGTQFTFFTSNTNTKPGEVLEENDTKGRSYNIVAVVDQPIIRTRDFNWDSSLSFDYLNSRSKDNLGGPITRDRVRALRLGSSIDFLDTMFKSAAYNSMSMTISKGIDVFNATDEKQGASTRPDSNGSSFVKAEAEFIRQQRITQGVSMLLAVKGQVSNGGLLSYEEFGFGGINYGRGYDNSEIIGDDGVAAKVEVQWNDPTKIEALDSYSVFAFYDIGKTWNDDASVPLEEQTRTSTGLGVRANITDDITANALVAFPLNREVLAEGNDGPRFFAGIAKSF